MVEQDECLCLKAKNKSRQKGNKQFKKQEEKLNVQKSGKNNFH
jgi:hypothetical protein